MSDGDRILDAATLGDHADRLYRAAWALCGSRADAEDLVQETFARVLAKPRRVRAQDDLGYLLQALRNTFLTFRRAAARRIVPVDAPDGFEPVDLSRARQPEGALEVHEVFTHIAGLTDGFRDALVAVDVVGLSYAEAAELLGVKEATITSRVYRARLQVARGMERVDPGVMLGEG
ncbi:MAG: polymerase sigma factor [Solirubrobacterales bacterium]|nr:polymerase sigma factor [Solirubrobacterales bacterium]